MKKIVINACHGGFSLSKEALDLCYQRGSKVIETFKPEKYYNSKSWMEEFKKDEEWMPLILRDDLLISSKRDEERDDPILISVVEELGDAANGNHAKLTIVKIPNDVEWMIEEYDGMEWISEKHRTWG